jgi:geranylgeranyl pyrophosphate synthase
MNMSTDLARFEAATRAQMTELLSPANSGVPAGLSAAIEYALACGGKRVRPILVYSAARAISDDRHPALDRAALALELVHTYSLIHDDLPAMDDDDLRRGQPTLHRAYDEATAILVGDGLQVLAFSLLAEAPELSAEQRLDMLTALARASGFAGMVGGQYIDVCATGQRLDIEQLRAMHGMKTGALIRCALTLGAVIGGAQPQQRAALDTYGEHIGLAFQVVDDILDVSGDSATLGKTGGKDAAANKSTYVSLLGLAGARAEARRLEQAALAAIAELGPGAESLRELAHYIIARDH